MKGYLAQFYKAIGNGDTSLQFVLRFDSICHRPMAVTRDAGMIPRCDWFIIGVVM